MEPLTWWCVSFSTLTPFTATTLSPAHSPDSSAGDAGSTLRMNCPVFPFSPCRWNPYPVSPLAMIQSRGFRSLAIWSDPASWRIGLKRCTNKKKKKRWEFRRRGLNFQRASWLLRAEAHITAQELKSDLKTKIRQQSSNFLQPAKQIASPLGLQAAPELIRSSRTSKHKNHREH